LRGAHPTRVSASSFKSALAIPIVLAGMTTSAQTPTGIVSLSELRNTSRPLLIFAPSPADPQLQIQLRRLHENAPALANRNIAVIAIPYNSPSPTSAQLTDTAAQSARRRFNIAPSDFTVILIGKDGGEKLRSTKPLTLDKLFDTIDAMPMRQQEMRPHPNP
jgi:hypothetical protein